MSWDELQHHGLSDPRGQKIAGQESLATSRPLIRSSKIKVTWMLPDIRAL
jgi:hypothetical protein